MAEFERIEKVSYLRIFTHNINKRKFMISCCAGFLRSTASSRMEIMTVDLSRLCILFCLRSARAYDDSQE